MPRRAAGDNPPRAGPGCYPVCGGDAPASDGLPAAGDPRDFTENGACLAVGQAEALCVHEKCIDLIGWIGCPSDAGHQLHRKIRVGIDVEAGGQSPAGAAT
jgi:hypothetical protein